jgi:hypothetical protein
MSLWNESFDFHLLHGHDMPDVTVAAVWLRLCIPAGISRSALPIIAQFFSGSTFCCTPSLMQDS